MSLEEYNYVETTKRADEEWDATEYKILHKNSGGGTFAPGSSQAIQTYICEYFHVERFIDTVLGKTVTGGATGIVRSAATPDFDPANGSLPQEHPFFYNFYANSAEVVPLGKSDNNVVVEGPVWNKAMVTVVFRPPPYMVLADDETSGDIPEMSRFTSVTVEPSVESLSSANFFYFVQTGNLLDSTQGKLVNLTKYNVTWHQIPITPGDFINPPNINSIKDCWGKVNDADFMEYGAGTVLLMSASWKLVMPQTASQNNYYWDITFVFGVRDQGDSEVPGVDIGTRIGWNYVFDASNPAGTGGWDLVTTDGLVTGGKLYQEEDFSALFTI